MFDEVSSWERDLPPGQRFLDMGQGLLELE
jgi:hypothetical protein